MELLLNLLWLVLAVPALLIWRRESASAGRLSGAYRSRTFVLLGCLLALLFPVVSATDDLHAMCQEAEEATPAKRIVKQSPGARSSARSWDEVSPAALIRVDSAYPANLSCAPFVELYPSVPQKSRPNTVGCRAPPSLSVA